MGCLLQPVTGRKLWRGSAAREVSGRAASLGSLARQTPQSYLCIWTLGHSSGGLPSVAQAVNSEREVYLRGLGTCLKLTHQSPAIDC